MGSVAAALPLVGLVSLLLRSELDPHIENYRLHFIVFGVVGAVAFGLGYAAGEAANRRGDARVLLLSLAFMATGGFLWLHAIGTPSILFSEEHSGFQIAIPVGCSSARSLRWGLRSSTSAPDSRPALMRRRTSLRLAWWARWACGLPGPSRVFHRWPGRTAKPPRTASSPRSRSSGRSCTRSAPGGTRSSSATVGTSCPPLSSPASRCCGGDDRRRGHRGAHVARQLVGVARPDRHRVPDRRLGRPSRMARRAIPTRSICRPRGSVART